MPESVCEWCGDDGRAGEPGHTDCLVSEVVIDDHQLQGGGYVDPPDLAMTA